MQTARKWLEIASCLAFTLLLEKLLSVGSELMLDKAMDKARVHEVAQTQLKTFANSAYNPSDQAVHAVTTQKESQK